MSVHIGDVPTFKHIANEKEQAIKILEEAGEVVDAFKAYREAALTDWTEPDNANEYRMACDHLIDECADVLQATCNLLSALNVVDMTKWIERCKAKNERRGREYERDLEPSVQVTEVGKTSASSRQSDGVDSREQLEADVQKWCGKYAYQADMVWAWLNRQAAITERELCKWWRDKETKYDERIHCISELQRQYDELTAERDRLKAMNERLQVALDAIEGCDERCLKLEAERDDLKEDNRRYKHDCELLWQEKRELTAQRDKLHEELRIEREAVEACEGCDKVDNLADERDMWRDKCGKMLDIAHEIARLGDIE